jgi:8-oxo-dGTP pyrophosphatase MutT (NUDIX family)
MRRREIVTCFLQHRGSILLLKRGRKVRTHQGKWAGVSGSIGDAEPLEQATREIHEETGLGEAEIELLAEGEPLDVADPEYGVLWIVHPFLFNVIDPSLVRLDWEHTESMWVKPADLGKLETVPMLVETWERLCKK